MQEMQLWVGGWKHQGMLQTPPPPTPNSLLNKHLH